MQRPKEKEPWEAFELLLKGIVRCELLSTESLMSLETKLSQSYIIYITNFPSLPVKNRTPPTTITIYTLKKSKIIKPFTKKWMQNHMDRLHSPIVYIPPGSPDAVALDHADGSHP